MKEMEEKLGKFVSKETIKAAKVLYQAGAVVFSYKEDDKTIVFVVKGKEKALCEIRIADIKSFIKERKQKAFSLLDIVVLFHFYQYYDKASEQGPDYSFSHRKETKTLPEKDEAVSIPKAKLLIYSKNSLPHSSSTWEACGISLEILYEGRCYIGNTNKLRQIRFDDGKASSVKLLDFSSQDRQIIRFLSQYAEPDGAAFSLRSELMTEFLHLLHGFSDFYFEKEQIVIRRGTAEIVGLYSKKTDAAVLYPALRVEDKIIPLKDEYRFVMGKSGIWIGILGEYLWVPAVYDVMWMRKFLLAKHLEVNYSLGQLKNYPVRVIDGQETALKEKGCTAEYVLDFTEDCELSLELKYNYKGVILPVSKSRIAEESGVFWKRDKVFEKKTEEELLRIGFRVGDSNSKVGCYVMRDVEGYRFFLG